MVGVDEDVAHPGHLTPGDLGVGRPKVLGQPLHRLANNLEVPRDRSLDDRSRKEIVTATRRELIDLVDRVLDVPQVDGRVFQAASRSMGTDSRRI